ncbi:MAG: holo-ACP synthase [Microthrixaceae bacterium]
MKQSHSGGTGDEPGEAVDSATSDVASHVSERVIGVGTDLVDVPQLACALIRTPGMKDRIFTLAEWTYAQRYKDPSQHLAARFAAKEAVMKSLGKGMGDMSFDEIEVTRDDSGKPSVSLYGRALEVATEARVLRFEVSLTHTATMAHSMVTAIGRVE